MYIRRSEDVLDVMCVQLTSCVYGEKSKIIEYFYQTKNRLTVSLTSLFVEKRAGKQFHSPDKSESKVQSNTPRVTIVK